MEPKEVVNLLFLELKYIYIIKNMLKLWKNE